MTDRLKGCYVVFDQDTRTDDAEPILNAIRMINGVAAVKGNVANADDWMNRERVRIEIARRLMSVVAREGEG